MGAAILLGIPTLAFEPNAVPGMANRLVGKRVKAAAVNFAPAAKYFRGAQVTGIPVRAEFFRLTAETAGLRLRICWCLAAARVRACLNTRCRRLLRRCWMRCRG